MPKTVKAGLRPQLDMESMVVVMRVMEGKKELARKEFDPADLPQAIQDRQALAGCSTLLQQRTSNIKEDPLAKLEAMDEVWAHWLEGKWEKDREFGPRLVDPILEVLAELKKADIGQIQKSWNNLTEEVQKEYRKKYADQVEAVLAKRERSEEIDLSLDI